MPSRLLRLSCFEDNLSFVKIIRTCDVAGFIDINVRKNLILLDKNLIQIDYIKLLITYLDTRKCLG